MLKQGCCSNAYTCAGSVIHPATVPKLSAHHRSQLPPLCLPTFCPLSGIAACLHACMSSFAPIQSYCKGLVGQAAPRCNLRKSKFSLTQHSRLGACPAELAPELAPALSAYLAPALGPATELAPELGPALSAYLAPAPGPAAELALIGTPGSAPLLAPGIAPELAPLPAPEVAPASAPEVAPGVAPGVAAGIVPGAAANAEAPGPGGPITNGFPVRLAVTGEELTGHAWTCTRQAVPSPIWVQTLQLPYLRVAYPQTAMLSCWLSRVSHSLTKEPLCISDAEPPCDFCHLPQQCTGRTRAPVVHPHHA